MAYERKHIVGNAAETATTATIDADDLTVTLVDATNYPDGTVGKFVLALDWNTPFEEKVLCTSRAGAVVTIAARGHDGTFPQPHLAGARVAHVLDAETVDQANRLANLLTAKGDLIAHNGTNPVRFAASGPGNDSQDGYVLQWLNAAGVGWVRARLVAMLSQVAAPAVAGVVRLWHDTTYNILRPSNGSAWVIPSQLISVADAAERDALLTAPANGNAVLRRDIDCIEIWDNDAVKWKPVGTARFGNETARDAYFTTALLEDGMMVYLATPDVLQLRRASRWVSIGQEITIAASQPSVPIDGDVWLQPVD